MKFTDGYWMTREGVTARYASQAYDLLAGDGTLTVYAPTTPIRRRRDTLNTPLATVTFDSPMADVARVRIDHHRGRPPSRPSFRVPASGVDDPDVKVAVGDDDAVLTSGDLSVRVRRGAPWQVDFEAAGRVLTTSGRKAVGLMTDPDGGAHVHEQLSLGVGEHVYGLGERFTPFVKNGQTVDIWNADGGTSSDQAYKNVPFYLTDGGYGVFVNDPGKVSFEIGSEVVSRVQFSVPGESLEYLVIYGPTPKEILRRYTALTGRAPRIPEWSFGLWLSTSFTTDYDERTVSGFVDEMADRDLPLSVFHFDCFWMRELNWCDFEWDPRTFPDPEGMLARLKARGLRICVWINPYIAQRSPLFAEGAAQGYLVRRRDGSVWQWDRWQAGMGLVDFTNPDAAAWYAAKLERLLDMGVDTFKTDFGERVPTDVVWYDGSDPHRMHNYYAQMYNATVFDLLRRKRGEGDAAVFARAATAGGQQFPVHWGGDCDSTYASMAESLRGGLSLALSGFGYWSHDIGGFEGTPDPGVFKRWLAFGLLSSHSRLHGNESYRVPWAFDAEAVEVARRFTHLKMSLMPYLARLAEEVSTDGTPLMRPMVLELPDDRAAATVDTQFMLGDSLLVAPVFSADGLVDCYVPEGTWTDLLSGERLTGPRWVRQQHGFDSLPVLVRPGTVLPVGARTDRPDYDYADGVTLRLFEIADGHRSRVTVPALGGGVAATFDVERTGPTIRVEAVSAGDAPVGSWRVQLGDAVLTPAAGDRFVEVPL